MFVHATHHSHATSEKHSRCMKYLHKHILALETINSLKVQDLDHTHSLVSL